MLTEYRFRQLSELENAQRIYLQQGGEPPPYNAFVIHASDEKFADRWIGREGLISWPARSRNLPPLRFFSCSQHQKRCLLSKRTRPKPVTGKNK